jgi:hypothetical protein
VAATAHQLSAFLGRKRFAPSVIRTRTVTSRGHPPPLVAHPLMQQILVQIQLTGDIDDTPIPIDH